MYSHAHKSNTINYLAMVTLCMLLVGCNFNIFPPSSNTPIGSGVQGVQVFVEPDAGDHIITSAIASARQSVWLEIYLLSDRNIIKALEESAHRSIDVRVMLELHPYGGGSPSRTIDLLNAAGIKAQPSNSSFALTHEKGMIIDNSTAYIMTSNFTRSALGGGSGYANREYDIVDTNAQDVQAVTAIFQADWDRTTAQFNDPNLVVSPVNSRSTFDSLINGARHTLLIEAEEMNDNDIEQALTKAVSRGIHVQVILPAPRSSLADNNIQGINTIKQGGLAVKEDSRLYMHAKIIIVDGQIAFVGSENISTTSLDQNRELGILVSDQGVLNTLQQTFQQDWIDSH